MPFYGLNIKSSISAKLLAVVFSIYVIVALTLTIIHVAVEYNNAGREVQQELENLQKAFQAGVA